MAKTCPFCGRNGPFNSEHVWPDWIGRLVFGYKRGASAPKAPHRRSSSIPSESDATWQAPSFTTTTNAICADCNGGWMSDLEDAAAPVLTPLLLGKRALLNLADQALVSRWVAKTAMTFQLTTPRRPIPPNHYRYLRDHLLPPPSAQVWIGIRTAEDGVVVSGLQSARIRVPGGGTEDAFHSAYLVTVGIALFAAQLSGNDLPRFDFSWGHDGEFTNALQPVWPTTDPVEWPPRQPIRSIQAVGEDVHFQAHLTRSLAAHGVRLETIWPK